MIAYLSGKVVRSTPESVIVDTGGVGYLVSIPTTARERVGPPGSAVALHIHTHVREDQLALYGFASPEELEMFERLIQVDGVGPKVGLAILSAASMDVLKRAILAEDVAPIRRASGVGPRTAQKVIIDLKPKLEAEEALLTIPRAAAAAGDGAVPKAVEEALRGLGFSAQQARAGVESVDWKAEPSAQDALAAALKALGR
ncbi:MAG TPA: Holliday junction branch migration protein RuvA [Candidatus Dormibacteraeota bacterium]